MVWFTIRRFICSVMNGKRVSCAYQVTVFKLQTSKTNGFNRWMKLNRILKHKPKQQASDALSLTFLKGQRVTMSVMPAIRSNGV